MNASLSPDQRADLVMKQLSLDQKIQLLHGTGIPGFDFGPPNPFAKDSDGGAGYVPGFPALGIPGIQMADSAYGVTRSGFNGRYATALPSCLGAASSWDPDSAYQYGALIGRELRAQGYTMSLGGGVDLAREPRDGRTFEYQGEDPLLAGTMVGNLIRGVQSEHVIGDIKHYAVNDQESGRTSVNEILSHRALRETDLLAFQIGIEIGNPGGVMCSYNRVNGAYACQNDYLLTKVLKQDWKFPGFVLSDWGGTHSTVMASHAGLDNEEPTEVFFGDPLKKAVQDGQVSTAELDDHVHRMLRSLFADGVVDHPPQKSVVAVLPDLAVAKTMEEHSIVLLRDQDHVLPIARQSAHTIVVIGRYADVGMVSGGGSAQVDPPGGNAIAKAGEKSTQFMHQDWFPDAPLAAIRKADPGATVTFDNGLNTAQAAAAARSADVALVFVYQWESEGMDLKTLALSGNQDALVEAVAAANPHTVVVLENGSPVLMPWVDKVTGIVESWYSGSDGADAIAAMLFGDVNPSGKLPITFPVDDTELPNPVTVQPPPASREDWEHDPKGTMQRMMHGFPAFDAHLNGGLEVGYKWYDAEHKKVLFPFGYGLSYTTYAYSGLKVDEGATTTVHLTITNTGSRAGEEIAEVYSTMPAAAQEPPKRLVGWTKVMLEPGESKQVTVAIPRERFNIWDESSHGWKIEPGEYTLMAGPSSQQSCR